MHVLKCSSSAAAGDGSSVAHVVGLGDPVMDILIHVSPELLSSVAEHIGGCIPVDSKELAHLLSVTSETSSPLRIPGGSAANVMKGLANLSAGSMKCQFAGMVGRDETAKQYSGMLKQQGVEPLLVESTSSAPTASCCCLITPDGQRTMRTCLGAAAELTAARLLPPGWAQQLRLLHCEGYCLYKPDLAREAMAAAKKAGACVSMDLASFELVHSCKDTLLQLLQEGLLDLVFANEEEAVALAEELAGGQDDTAAGNDADPPGADCCGIEADPRVAQAQQLLLRHVKVSIVSLGARGCIARGRGGEVGACTAPKVKVVDTIGAGDFFSSGFLFAYLAGCSLQQCAAAGCCAGGEAVQAQGAVLSQGAWMRLRGAVSNIISSSRSSNTPAKQKQQQQQQEQRAQPAQPAVAEAVAELQKTHLAVTAA